MKIKGLQKLTLLDFPERIACTVFLGGCNFRCPFCHNASLVLPERFGEDITEDGFFDFLASRQGRLSGVCVSGGEPTLYRELPYFLEKIKKMGYATKLDTNGYNPKMLEDLIAERLVDYVAMDIKNSRERYGETAGLAALDISLIEKSAELLMKCGVPFEFRTTVCRELHTEEDIRKIGEWLRGEEKFYLQSFKNSGDILGGDFSAYSDEEMKKLHLILKEYIRGASLRV
ncbi:MAG: anaerobic ribonucleoside-triphosphate reductase activating protein [Clostridia bacterium]|nr:anaerobic ribonucleoside-triphosphate reductase activating protein [Clostridia bacterium]